MMVKSQFKEPEIFLYPNSRSRRYSSRRPEGARKGSFSHR
jgi:hypothetical protein